jgi:hypothetical protein
MNLKYEQYNNQFFILSAKNTEFTEKKIFKNYFIYNVNYNRVSLKIHFFAKKVGGVSPKRRNTRKTIIKF